MARRSTKYYRKNESEVMRKLGFKPTKNSGAGWLEKEDGENDFCLCQLKSTDKESISIKQKDLHTLEYNAIVSHKTPVLVIQFIQNDEVYLLIKPEDLEQIKGIVSGSSPEKKSFFDIDSETEDWYNNIVHEKIRSENYSAREQYYKKKVEEREQKMEELKQKLKEGGKDWRKNLNRKGWQRLKG